MEQTAAKSAATATIFASAIQSIGLLEEVRPNRWQMKGTFVSSSARPLQSYKASCNGGKAERKQHLLRLISFFLSSRPCTYSEWDVQKAKP